MERFHPAIMTTDRAADAIRFPVGKFVFRMMEATRHVAAIPGEGCSDIHPPGQAEVDSLVGSDHPARMVWSYVQQVELSRLLEQIGETASAAPFPPMTLRSMLALWLYACIEGVGSAARIAHLSKDHEGFRWLLGGQEISREALSSFRWRTAVDVDRQLLQGVVSLWSEGLVSVASLSDDCIRVRASRAFCFRRLATFDRLLWEAENRISRLRQEIDAEPGRLPRHLSR